MIEDISGENDNVEKFAACCKEKEKIERKLNDDETPEEEKIKLRSRFNHLKKQMDTLMKRLS